MDLNEFSRAYKQAEGVGNTPVKAVERILNLLTSIVDIPRAIKMDERKRIELKENREKYVKEMVEDGFSFGALFDYAKNINISPSSNTAKAVSRTAKSGLDLGLSVNEAASTAAAIAGTKRTNVYDGQDMETGVRFLLNAKNVAAQGLGIAKGMTKGIGLVVMTGAIVGTEVPSIIKDNIDISRARSRGHEVYKNYDWGRDDR